MTRANPWEEIVLRSDESKVLEFGTLRLGLRRAARELWLQAQRVPDPVEADAGPWERWAVGAESRIRVHPAMPSRMLVVSTEHPYYLPPGGESRFYVRIPLFVQIAVKTEKHEVVVADIPSMVLSDTWWGSFAEGELAFWLTTKARMELTDDLFPPHVGVCPVRLINDSPDALPVARFAVRVPHLSLFSHEGRNWTDEVRVRYEDAPEGSEIRFFGKPPPEAPAAQLISRPRLPTHRGFRARTFDRLLSISNLAF